jgi:UDP-2,3-diacylglucosamine pyrophosphatase LpxH
MTRKPIQCRSVFISDVHLGAVGCKVASVQDFLKNVRCENLYLVGDIIDGWVTREKRWKQEHSNIIRTILGMAQEGTRVCYTPGNHDAFMRRLNGFELGFVELEHEFVHIQPDGKELLVVHGDLFDPSSSKHAWLAWLGAWMYEYIQLFNNGLNKRRAKNRRRRIDIAAPVKRLCKAIFTRRDYYDLLLIEHAREQGFEGVICGHVHRPEIRRLEDDFFYINTGDWVENCTAVIEHFDGSLELIYWEPLLEMERTEPRPAMLRLRGLVASRPEVR